MTVDDIVVLLAGAVDGNLDSDLTALNLLAVHLAASLLLEFFGSESNEAEATTLARLVAGLKLLDHEARDGAEGNLRAARRVVLEDFHKAVLTEVVGEVGDHDLGLGSDTVLRWATLLALTRSAGLGLLVGIDSHGVGVAGLSGGESLLGGLDERVDLARDVGGASSTVGSCGVGALAIASGSTATTTTAGTATTGAVATTGLAGGAFTSRDGTLSLNFWATSKLDGDLALEDGLAVELGDGTLGLRGSGEIDEGVADGAAGTGVDRDGDGFTVSLLVLIVRLTMMVDDLTYTRNSLKKLFNSASWVA